MRVTDIHETARSAIEKMIAVGEIERAEEYWLILSLGKKKSLIHVV